VPKKTRRRNKWVEAGFVGVNSGSIVIMDAIDAIYNGDVIQKWSDDLDKLDRSSERLNANFHRLKWTYKNQSGQPIENEALISRTEFGDGNYRVWARLDENGRVQELRIPFDVSYGYDDDSKEMHDIAMPELFRKVVDKQASDTT